MNAFDRSLCLRALAYSALALAVVAVVIVATDEAYSTTAMRIARLSALAPALGAVGTAAAAAQAERRGELLALAALGNPPERAVLGAVVGGWMVGGLATLALLSPLADAGSLFPALTHGAVWIESSGALQDVRGTVRVAPDGTLAFAGTGAATTLEHRPAGAWGALATAPLALVAPPWSVGGAATIVRASTLVATAALVVAMLHAVAAGRLGPAWLVAGAGPMAVTLAARRLRRRTS